MVDKKDNPVNDEKPKGLMCPGCGCAEFSVNKTRRIKGGIRRRKVCAYCGKYVWTTERVMVE